MKWIVACFLLAFCQTGNGFFAWTEVDAQTVANSNVKPRAYEIVSIKPDMPGTRGGSMETLPNGFRDTNINLASIVRDAYGILRESQVVGMPGWAESERYDVEVRVEPDTAEAWKSSPRKNGGTKSSQCCRRCSPTAASSKCMARRQRCPCTIW